MDVPHAEEGGSAVSDKDRSILYTAFHTALLDRAEQDRGDHGLHPAINNKVSLPVYQHQW